VLLGQSSAVDGVDRTALKPAITSNDYKICPTDILDISVFQEPDLKSVLRVSNEGTITFPLIGAVPVQGLSTQLASREIEHRLAPGYLVNPQVSVTVMEFNKRKFTVLGEVQKPGAYDMPDQQDVTVLQAIGMAGGYTRLANPKRVVVMRKSGGSQQVFQLNARSMANGGAESAFRVDPGDVITIGETMF
jgi:polysaccharide export outer membrane protein